MFSAVNNNNTTSQLWIFPTSVLRTILANKNISNCHSNSFACAEGIIARLSYLRSQNGTGNVAIYLQFLNLPPHLISATFLITLACVETDANYHALRSINVHNFRNRSIFWEPFTLEFFEVSAFPQTQIKVTAEMISVTYAGKGNSSRCKMLSFDGFSAFDWLVSSRQIHALSSARTSIAKRNKKLRSALFSDIFYAQMDQNFDISVHCICGRFFHSEAKQLKVLITVECVGTQKGQQISAKLERTYAYRPHSPEFCRFATGAFVRNFSESHFCFSIEIRVLSPHSKKLANAEIVDVQKDSDNVSDEKENIQRMGSSWHLEERREAEGKKQMAGNEKEREREKKEEDDAKNAIYENEKEKETEMPLILAKMKAKERKRVSELRRLRERVMALEEKVSRHRRQQKTVVGNTEQRFQGIEQSVNVLLAAVAALATDRKEDNGNGNGNERCPGNEINAVNLKSAIAVNALADDRDGNENENDNELKAFLTATNYFEKYHRLFVENGVGMEELEWMTDGDLKDIGVEMKGHRVKLLRSFRKYQNEK